MSTSSELAVLLVCDSESDAATQTLALEQAGYQVHARRVQDADEMALALTAGPWDVVLCDHVLARFNSRAALALLATSTSDIPLIVVSEMVGEEAAAAVIRSGAVDFVSKDHLSRLAGAVRTELRDAQFRAAQRRTEAQFRSAFDDAPFGSSLIALGSDAGRVLRVNRALCEATGYTRERLLGARVQDLLHPDERARFENGLDAVLDGRTPLYRTETRLIRAAGTESWFLFSVSHVPSPGGQEEAVAHFVDIDARKRVEEALQLAHSQALEASRMKSEFVVNMSHELRTPLNGVVGLAGLLADTDLTADQSAYVTGIRSSGQVLMGVIGGILDFSKIEAGTLTIDPADFEPAELLNEVCTLLAPSATEKRLELTASVDAAVPDLVHADAGRIRQVLTNLAGNAVKFTDDGEVVIRLSLDRQARGQLRFDVTDSGPGIEDDARPFEPFWQADSSMTRNHGGTGLGLAIAERMVELLGGRVHFENAPGVGSHFWFAVPYEPARGASETVAGLVGVRALLADDNDNRRVIVERLLVSLGARVTVVSGGEAALAELQAGAAAGNPYEIAALEQRLPTSDGDDAAAAVKRAPSLHATRVLLLETTPVSARPVGVASADGSLCEPLTRSSLAVELARLLGLGSVASSAQRLSGRGRLLLVEDDAINRLFAVNLLRGEGWDVEVAEDGAQAVELAAGGGYDAILMDCQMPKLDGYGATEEIRRIEGLELHTPIIAVTAHATAYDRQRCLVAGMDAYVAKPFTTAQLEDALRRSLGRSPQGGATGPLMRHEPLAAGEKLPVVLDTSQLAQVDVGVRMRLVEVFIDSVGEWMTALRAAEASSDPLAISALVHTLKGASATIGARRMNEACDRLGKAVARGRTDQIPVRQGDLEKAFALTATALTEGYGKAAG